MKLHISFAESFHLIPEQKTHKIIHELAKPKPADGSSSNPGEKL